ncbi:MAG TPA: hypothetical protein DDW52_12350, partial [Planctomycetaceae bacterium]|nr:hypothetical protein [Planctomycetaceae bacterium]
MNRLIALLVFLALPAKLAVCQTGSGIDEIAATPAVASDLATLCKVWGLVKYHHPGLAAGDVDWDAELFHVIPAYLAEESSSAKADCLVEWLEKLGPIKEAKPAKSAKKKCIEPDLHWVDELSSERLIVLLKAIVASRHAPTSYVRFDLSGLVSFVEKPYESLTYPDTGYRLLALFRYWNIVQYYSPYRELPDVPWSQTLNDFVPKFLNASDALEYRLAILELTTRLQDGHANGGIGDDLVSKFWGVNQSLVRTRFIEDSLVVTGFWQEEIDSAIEVGDVIKTIDGVPAKLKADRLATHIPASNQPTLMSYITLRMLRSNAEEIVVEFERNSKLGTTTIPCVSMSQLGKLRKEKQAKAGSAWKVKDGIGYIHLDNFTDEQRSEIMDEMMKVDRLVVDARGYPRGKIKPLLNSFLRVRTPFVLLSFPKPDEPGAYTQTQQSVGYTRLDTLIQRPKIFEGKVAILVNVSTQSFAEHCAAAVRVAPKAKVFGSTTAGADGNVVSIVLPGGFNTRISGLGVYTPDGEFLERKGVIPNVSILPTVNDVKQGNDRVLHVALDWLNCMIHTDC